LKKMPKKVPTAKSGPPLRSDGDEGAAVEPQVTKAVPGDAGTMEVERLAPGMPAQLAKRALCPSG